MLDDYQILQHLGLEAGENSLLFYNDAGDEYRLKPDQIKGISVHKAFTPVEDRAIYWLKKLFSVRSGVAALYARKKIDDYRDYIELEIELTSGEILSRKVKRLKALEMEDYEKIIHTHLKTG